VAGSVAGRCRRAGADGANRRPVPDPWLILPTGIPQRLANSEIEFWNSFLTRKLRPENNLASGKTAKWILEKRFNREKSGGK